MIPLRQKQLYCFAFVFPTLLSFSFCVCVYVCLCVKYTYICVYAWFCACIKLQSHKWEKTYYICLFETCLILSPGPSIFPSTLLFFMGENSIVCPKHIFLHPFFCWLLGQFHNLGIVQGAAVNTGVQHSVVCWLRVSWGNTQEWQLGHTRGLPVESEAEKGRKVCLAWGERIKGNTHYFLF